MDSNSDVQPVNPAPAPGNEPLPSIPSSWPGAFGLYKYSSEAVKFNLVTLAMFWLISAGASFVLQFVLKVPGQVLGYLFSALAAAGYTLAYIAGVRRRELPFEEAFNKALPLWLKVIGLDILVILSIMASFACLVAPFFFVLPRLSLANYFLVDKNLGVTDAYKASWAATKGYSGKIWGIIGVNLLMVMLCITIIGIPVAIYLLVMYSGAPAVTYEFINKAQATPSNAPAGMPPAK